MSEASRIMAMQTSWRASKYCSMPNAKCQMPILRAAASASLKRDCTDLRASRESGSLQRFVSASIEYGTVGTLVGQ